VAILGATLNVIVNGDSTNLAARKRQIDQQTGASGSSSDPVERASADSAPVRLIVDPLEFANRQTHVSSEVLGELDIKVPDISAINLGRDVGGLTVEQLAHAIIKPLAKRVTRALIQEGLDEERLQDALKERARDKVDSKLKMLSERLQSRD